MQHLAPLRLEKAYRDFGVDVDNTGTPIGAGLGVAVTLDGAPVGHVEVGACGHISGGAVGIGFAKTAAPITAEVVANGRWEIEIAGQRVAATASLKPLFDASMACVKA